MNENRLDIRWQWLILIALVGFVIWLLRPVLAPFLLAALFAYLGDPIADRLEKRMPRAVAVSLVFLVMIGQKVTWSWPTLRSVAGRARQISAILSPLRSARGISAFLAIFTSP